MWPTGLVSSERRSAQRRESLWIAPLHDTLVHCGLKEEPADLLQVSPEAGIPKVADRHGMVTGAAGGLARRSRAALEGASRASCDGLWDSRLLKFTVSKLAKVAVKKQHLKHDQRLKNASDWPARQARAGETAPERCARHPNQGAQRPVATIERRLAEDL